MTVFRSKVDPWYWMSMMSSILLIAVCVYVYTTGTSWMIYISLVGVAVVAVMLGMLYGIRYEIFFDHIHIRAWVFGKWDVYYSDILHIRKSEHSDNTACLSSKRIEIRTKDGIVTISPDRDAFLNELSEHFPEAKEAI